MNVRLTLKGKRWKLLKRILNPWCKEITLNCLERQAPPGKFTYPIKGIDDLFKQMDAVFDEAFGKGKK